MNYSEIIKKAWRNTFSDTDYPNVGSSEMSKCVDFLNDGIGEWERLAKKGAIPTELITRGDFVFAGTGADSVPSDFVSFIPSMTDKGYQPYSFVTASGKRYRERSAREGIQAQSGYVFWLEGKTIRTYPALMETLNLPYVRTATRVVTGDETTEPECPDHDYLVAYVSSYLANDDENDTKYELFGVKAVEGLSTMEYNYHARLIDDSII